MSPHDPLIFTLSLGTPYFAGWDDNMRVLDTHSGQFANIDPKDKKIKYAILSHTWDRNGEQTYQKLRKIQKQYAPLNGSSSDGDDPLPSQSEARARPLPTFVEPPLSPIWNDRKLSPKIPNACRIARDNGYRYLWIDSCCIDKTSSSELSESINSMYQWYACADICYAFLADVPAAGRGREQERSGFHRSRWFTRGWTLQELIAPLDVWFLTREWKFIGSKHDLAGWVAGITGIQYNALLHIEPLEEFSVAQRLSWASSRETTREEDRAYSLLGIFDINMPTLYGEGERAFRRLQEEIMRRIPDQSLFVWAWFRLDGTSSRNLSPNFPSPCDITLWNPSTSSLLASALARFRDCANIEALSHDEVARRLQLPPDDLPTTDYDFTPYGIRMQLPVISLSDYFRSARIQPDTLHADMTLSESQCYLIILRCEHAKFPGHLLARICYVLPSESGMNSLRCGYISVNSALVELLIVSPADVARLSPSQISIKTLYIPQPGRDQGADNLALRRRHETIKLVLAKKTYKALSAHGYTPTLRPPDDAHPRTHSVTLSHSTHTVTIDYHHTLEDDSKSGQRLTIDVDVDAKASAPGPPQAQAPNTPRDPRAPQVDGDPESGTPSRVSWWDLLVPGSQWLKEFEFHGVELDVPADPVNIRLVVRLGLAFTTTDHYLLRIQIKPKDSTSDP